MFKKNNSSNFLSIDLNAEYLKVVHVRLSGLKREVVGLESREIHDKPDDEIAVLLKKIVADFKVKNAHVLMSVPLRAVITRAIEIPSRDSQEIREIVNLQASRHTPYARSEIIIDTLILGTVRESYTKVLLVIAPRDLVTRHTKILESAGLKLEKVFFPPEGICYACAKIVSGEGADSVIAIVHMDATFTSFIVSQKGHILFVRGISIGADHLLKERDVYSDRFVEELDKSLESYLGDEAGPRPALLLLTGVVAEIHELDPLFSETLHIPIKHQTYFNHFSISNEARAVASSSRFISFFDLIAPTLLFDKIKLDLVSEERRLKMQLEKRGQEALRVAMLGMILLALLFTTIVEKIYFKTAQLHRLTSRYKNVKQESKDLEKLFTKTQAVKGYLAKRGSSIDALSELYDSLPMEIRLVDVKYEDGQRFTVKGTSKTMSAVFAFVSNLEKSKEFKNVKTKYVTARTEDGADVADFEINTLIEGGGAA